MLYKSNQPESPECFFQMACNCFLSNRAQVPGSGLIQAVSKFTGSGGLPASWKGRTQFKLEYEFDRRRVMNNLISISASGLITGLILALCSSAASAHDHGRINWSISVGTPYPTYGLPYAYPAPPPIFVQPQSVYVEPPPVLRYRPRYYVEAPPYYVEPPRYHHRHHQWRHHHHRP